MSEQTFNTRIILKHDIEAHWNLATGFIPRKGEIVIYDADESHAYPRFKIGDGVQQADGTIVGTKVNDLPFLHTLRTEIDPTVPAWAKEPNKPSYTASEVGADVAGTADTLVSTHANNKSNPHEVTAAQLGLKTESWTFTLEDGTIVTKAVYVG